MKIEDLIINFKGVKSVKENKYMALCPAHDDKNPSLSIGLSPDRKRILLHCFAGCETDDILKNVGLEPKNLFLNEKGKRTMEKTTYNYYKKDGSIAYPFK